MRKRIMQKRIWFLSYIMTVLVCMLIGYTVTGFSERVLKNQIDETMAKAFENTVSGIEHRLSSLQTNIYALLQNQDVVTLSNKYSHFERDVELDTIGRIMDEMGAQLANSDCADYHYICFDNKDIVIGRSDSLTKKAAYRQWFSEIYTSEDEWLSDIFSTRNFIDYKVYYDKIGRRKVAVIQKSIRNIGARPPMVAISIVDESRVFDTLYKSTASKTVILHNDEVVFTSQDGFEYSNKAESGTRVTIDGRRYIQFDMELNGLYFIQLFDNESYTNRLSRIRLVGFLTNLLILAIGIMIAAYFTRINYRPLSRIMSRLRADVSDENEYIAIERSIENVLNDRTAVTKRLRETDRRLAQTYNKLLLVAGSKNEIKSVVDNLKIKFEHRYFALASFSLYSLGIVAGDGEDGADTEIAAFSVFNVFSELLPEDITCDWCLSDNRCVCILNFSHRDKIEYVYDTAREACEFMKTHFKMQLAAYISDCAGLGDLPELRVQFETLMKPASMLPGRVCFLYGDYAEYAGEIWNENFKEALADAVAAGDGEQATKIINEFFTLGLLGRSDGACKQIYYETLLPSYMALKGSNDDGSALAELVNSGRYNDAKKEFITAFKRLASSGAEGENEKIREIIAFIEKNYTNMDLNVSYISNHFNVSISRLSRYFKNNANEGLAEYILRYRCARAVEYLESNPDMPVNEIGEACGFYSTGSFIRAFKRIYGVTPGKYNKE